MNKPKDIYPVIKLYHQRQQVAEKVKGSWDWSYVDGGTTIMECEWALGSKATGLSYCSPADSYNKILGKSVALGRMLRGIPDSKRMTVAMEARRLFGKFDHEMIIAGFKGTSVGNVLEQRLRRKEKDAKTAAKLHRFGNQLHRHLPSEAYRRMRLAIFGQE